MENTERDLALKTVSRHWFGAEKARVLAILKNQDMDWRPSPLCARCFGATAGIPVFHEQVVDACGQIAGFSPEMGRKLCAMLGKRDAEASGILRERFMQGAIERGFDRRELEELYAEIERSAIYLCPKALSINET